MNSEYSKPDFFNIQVTVIPVPAGTGNAGKTKNYRVTCTPEAITVTHTDSVINYQLIPDTPDDIVFCGMSQSDPIDVPQLSRPSIAVDGKLLTFSDLNSVAEDIHITLKFAHRHELAASKDHEAHILFDPQVGNEPQV